jgi:hypothetical protein
MTECLQEMLPHLKIEELVELEIIDHIAVKGELIVFAKFKLLVEIIE